MTMQAQPSGRSRSRTGSIVLLRVLLASVLVIAATTTLAVAPGSMRPGSPQDSGFPTPPPSAGPGRDPRWAEEIQRRYAARDWTALADHARKWLAAEPDSVIAGNLLGFAQMRLGRNADARATLGAVAARHPDDETTQLYLAWAHLGVSDAPAAERAARRLLERAPSVVEAWVVLAYAHLLSNRLDDAAAAVAAGLERDPNFIGLWLTRTEVLEAQGRYASALEAIERAASLGVLDEDAQRKRALLLARSGRIDEAGKLLGSFKASVPFDAVVWNQIGIEAFKAGRRSDAQSAYRRATELQSTWITPWANLASLHQHADRWDDAERAWRRALDAQPADAGALSGLAQALTLLGRRSEAAAVLQRAEQAQGAAVDDLRAQAAAYFNLNQWRAAIGKYEQVTKIDASQVADWVYLGNAHAAVRQREEARSAYTRAEAIDRNHPGLLTGLAKFHGEAGDFARALEYSERGTKLRPGDALLWNAKGYSLLQLGRYPEAVAALDTAAGLQPQAPAAWINLGHGYFRLRAYADAIRALQRAVQIAPMAGDARILLARALASTGQWQAAEANLDYLLARAPNTAEAWYVLGLIGYSRGAAKDYKLAHDELADFAPSVAAALKRRTSGKPPTDPADLFQ